MSADPNLKPANDSLPPDGGPQEVAITLWEGALHVQKLAAGLGEWHWTDWGDFVRWAVDRAVDDVAERCMGRMPIRLLLPLHLKDQFAAEPGKSWEAMEAFIEGAVQRAMERSRQSAR